MMEDRPMMPTPEPTPAPEGRQPLAGLSRAMQQQEQAAAAQQASDAYGKLADNLVAQSVSYPDNWVRDRYANAAKAIRRLANALSETAVLRRN